MDPTAAIRYLRDPRHRGLLLDLAVFVFSAGLFFLLNRISRLVVLQAEYDRSAKLTVGLFFVGLLLLQPWGPWLKRRPFHARHPGFGESKESLAGCWVALIGVAYLFMLLIVAGAASTMISEVAFAGGSSGETVGVLGVLLGLIWAIFNSVLFVRFFLPPKKAGRPFLSSPRAESIADVTIFLNVIFLQIVWGAVMSSQIFWEVVLNTPLGKPGSATAILGRFIVIAAVAFMVYLPPRLFYLVEERRRRWALVTMAVANLPIILKALLATGQ